MKVLFAASEAYPFAMTGGLADVAGALPKALRKRLVGCRVVIPLYECVPAELLAWVLYLLCPILYPRKTSPSLARTPPSLAAPLPFA